jgi:hypothetical protein
MRRLSALRGAPVVLAGTIVVLAAGGGYAIASSKPHNINACIKRGTRTLYTSPCHHGDKKVTWNTTGPQGVPGLQGTAGVAGTPGQPGTPGGPGFVSTGGWAGGVATIPGPSSGFIFAGKTATLTTTATQSIIASGSAAMGSAAATTAEIAICVEPSTGGTLKQLDSTSGSFYIITSTAAVRGVYPASAVGSPGAGTWLVGECVDNTGTSAFNNNDFSIGYAFVANGIPTSQ